jgi:hypothetical protein
LLAQLTFTVIALQLFSRLSQILIPIVMSGLLAIKRRKRAWNLSILLAGLPSVSIALSEKKGHLVPS